jgi:lysophospholipase L1-like esterase
VSRGRTGTALGALLLLAACSSSGGYDGPGPTPVADPGPAGSPTVQQYVALGDSYTAAPFVPVTDLAGGCLRSDGNYPQLLADALGATVTDVSCGGATTADLTGRQSVADGRGTVPPQLRAVRAGTDLVTLGIGGNDGGLFVRLASACIGPDREPLARCRPLAAALTDAAQVIGRTGRRVAADLRAVRRAAPAARVVLVGYPRLADPARSCAGLALSPADRRAAARLEGRLDTALRRAARVAGALFADVHAASRGHEVCSGDPWVNGGRTDPRRALAFHPFAVEQRAVARSVAALLALSAGFGTAAESTR